MMQDIVTKPMTAQQKACYEKAFQDADNGVYVDIEIYPTGELRLITYHDQHFRRHRIDGPANMQWHINGKLWAQTYSKDGLFYRENGPAAESWYDNGQKHKEEYFVNDSYHRRAIDGPAYQEWDRTGKKIEEVYYEHDVEIHDVQKHGPFNKTDGGLGRVFI